MSTFEITSDVENPLLERRELKGIFHGGNGLLTRQGASEAIASKIGVDKEKVQVISLDGKFGVRDLSARAYVFTDKSGAKKQLASYFFIRNLSKEERVKAKEERKKAKTAGPKAPPAKAKSAETPAESKA